MVVFDVGSFVMRGVQVVCVFFFQAEDGIRDDLVTGVQTCALPILFILIGSLMVIVTSVASITVVGYSYKKEEMLL